MGYNISSGVCLAPQKVVIYGPEGIGKSTFASKFPSPIFIDTEGGTKKLNVNRLPAPTSWAMLLDEVDTVRRGALPPGIECETLVIDTADWAEKLCVRAICAKAKVNGIEDFGYGKGYTYSKEEFGRLLDLLDGVIESGRNVVITAHAQITKFEQPDEMGQYDRWSMKTSKQVAPILREWCDMLLFANYRTYVIRDGDGKNAKSKAQGSERIMYTTHHACWDAKNRDGLPDTLPFDYSSIAAIIPRGMMQQPAPAPERPVQQPPKKLEPPKPAPAPASAPAPAPAQPTPEAPPKGIFGQLKELMVAGNTTENELQKAVAMRGCYPEDMPITDYDPQFVEGSLISSWAKWLAFINENCKPDSGFTEITADDLPF